jgi:hypothetical protein
MVRAVMKRRGAETGKRNQVRGGFLVLTYYECCQRR